MKVGGGHRLDFQFNLVPNDDVRQEGVELCLPGLIHRLCQRE